MKESMMKWLEEMVTVGMFDDVVKILSLNPSSGEYKPIWNAMESIYDNVCVPIGMGLVLIYFMINLIEKSLQQQGFDLEHFFKALLKLFVGLYFINNGLDLMASIYSLSFGLVNQINQFKGSGPDMSGVVEPLWEDLTLEPWEVGLSNVLPGWGLFQSIKMMGAMIELMIPFIVSKILIILINFVCYSRLVEFYIRTCAAPIALSDFFVEGTHSNGWRFIKSYIAIALQTAVIMLAYVVFSNISGVILQSAEVSYWGFIAKYFALSFATVGVMLKSLSLTKEIVGAN